MFVNITIQYSIEIALAVFVPVLIEFHRFFYKNTSDFNTVDVCLKVIFHQFLNVIQRLMLPYSICRETLKSFSYKYTLYVYIFQRGSWLTQLFKMKGNVVICYMSPILIKRLMIFKKAFTYDVMVCQPTR